MLGKLIKYDLKALNPILIFVHAFLLLAALCIRIFISGRLFNCSRSKFLTKLLKTFDKNFPEIFPDFTDTKRRAEPSAFLTVILLITPTLQQELLPRLCTW